MNERPFRHRLYLFPLALLVLAILALSIDCQVAAWCRAMKCPKPLHDLFSQSEPFGHGLGVLLVALAIFQLDPGWRRVVPWSLASAGAAGLAANAVKMLVARWRPDAFFEQLFHGWPHGTAWTQTDAWPVWSTFQGWPRGTTCWLPLNARPQCPAKLSLGTCRHGGRSGRSVSHVLSPWPRFVSLVGILRRLPTRRVGGPFSQRRAVRRSRRLRRGQPEHAGYARAGARWMRRLPRRRRRRAISASSARAGWPRPPRACNPAGSTTLAARATCRPWTHRPGHRRRSAQAGAHAGAHGWQQAAGAGWGYEYRGSQQWQHPAAIGNTRKSRLARRFIRRSFVKRAGW